MISANVRITTIQTKLRRFDKADRCYILLIAVLIEDADRPIIVAYSVIARFTPVIQLEPLC